MGLFRPERRAVSTGEMLQAVMARRSGDSGPIVDADSALRLSAVWACVRLLAGVGSTLPLDQFRTVDGQRTPVPASSLFLSPSPDVSLTTWLYQLWSSLLLDGNAYGLVTGIGANGYPSSVDIIDPACVQWRSAPDGWHSLVDGKDLKRWPMGPLWHTPLFTRAGQPFGMSPIENARQTIGAGMSAESFGAQFFQGGGNPNAIIYSESELSAEQAGGIKSAFVSATSNNREPAVMGAGLKYERIQINPDEAQFIDSQRFTVEQIARVYGVFPEMIGGATSGSSVTYANREQRAADWLTFGFMPYLVPLEESLSSLVPRPQRIKFNVDALLRSDLKTRYESYQIGIGAKFLTPNEARDLEDMPPLDGGDTFAEPAPAPMPPVDDSPEDVPA